MKKQVTCLGHRESKDESCTSHPSLGFSVLWRLSGARWSGGKLVVGITTLLHHMYSGHLPTDRKKARINHISARIWASRTGVWVILCVLYSKAASPCCQWKSLAFYSFLTCPPHNFFRKGCPTDHGRTKCQHAGAFICCPLTCRSQWVVCQHFPGHIFSCFF